MLTNALQSSVPGKSAAITRLAQSKSRHRLFTFTANHFDSTIQIRCEQLLVACVCVLNALFLRNVFVCFPFSESFRFVLSIFSETCSFATATCCVPNRDCKMLQTEIVACISENTSVCSTNERNKSVGGLRADQTAYPNGNCTCTLVRPDQLPSESKASLSSPLPSPVSSSCNFAVSIDRCLLLNQIGSPCQDANESLRVLLRPESNGRPLPTEQRNPSSMHLSEMNSLSICNLMWNDTNDAQQTLQRHLPSISQMIDHIVECMRKGGRLLYVGAGNSGRLAVVDAVECPPTFGCLPGQVQVLLAGGDQAMNNEIEGVEDDALSGLLRMNSLKPTTNDFVLGVTASGLTSFVWGSMFAAYRAGCCTGLLSFNPHIIPRFRLQHLIRFDCGPEILTGSTRLKCGTISKVVLNMISTASMVQLGKCMSNLMTDVQPTNAKLKQRLANILVDLAKDDPSIPQSINSHEAHQLLIQHNYKIRSAIQQLRSESSIKFRD